MITIDPLEKRQLFAAGAVDTSFGGGDGTVSLKAALLPFDNDAAVDDKGRTIYASIYRSQQKITLTRLLPDGSVDASFGHEGMATIDTGFNAKARGTFQITVDHAGKTLVMFKNRLTRVNESGGVDKKFGKSGSISMPMFSDVGDLAVDASNRPVVIGTAAGKTGTRGTVARFGPRGVLDPSFAASGVYKTPVPTNAQTKNPGNATGATLKVLADSSVIGVTNISVARSANETYTGENGVQTFHLDQRGALDGKYGKGGFARVTSSYAEYDSGASRVEAFYADGGMIVGNATTDYSTTDTGRRDKTWTKINRLGRTSPVNFEGLAYEVNGQDQTPILPPENTSVIAITPDNKVLVRAGASQMYRYNADFTRDTSFTGASGLPASSLPSLPIASAQRGLLFSTVMVDDTRTATRITAIEL